MAGDTLNSVMATLQAAPRSLSAVVARETAEWWGNQCDNDWTVVAKWLASNTAITTPGTIPDRVARPTGTTRDKHRRLA